jgi:hypothetical protein
MSVFLALNGNEKRYLVFYVPFSTANSSASLAGKDPYPQDLSVMSKQSA